MIVRQIFNRMPMLFALIKAPTVPTHVLNYRYSFFKKRQDRAQPKAKIMSDEMINTNPQTLSYSNIPTEAISQIYQLIHRKPHISQQILLLKKTLQIVRKKNFRFELSDKENIRQITKDISYDKLNETSLENIQTIAQFYLLAVGKDIIMHDSKSEHSLYEAFIKKIEKFDVNNTNSWMMISRCYQTFSEFPIIYPALHTQLPSYAYTFLKENAGWKHDKHILLNIINGLGKRQILLKEERSTIILIISYFDKIYNELDEVEKVNLVKELILLNFQNKNGFSLRAEEAILSYFLKDLEGNKLNTWTNKVIDVVDNKYSSQHVIMNAVTQMLVQESFQHIDAKGQTHSPLATEDFLKVILSYSKKYSINSLTQIQKAKLLEFFKSEIDKNNEELIAQKVFALIISHHFFIGNYHVLKLLLQHSKAYELSPRLLFELTWTGIKIDKKYLTPLQNSSVRVTRLSVQELMQSDDLLILIIARMQLEINPKSQYYKSLCDKYMSYLRVAADKNSSKLLIEITKLPQISLYYMQKLLNLAPIIEIIEQKPPENRYFIKKAYIYFLIKYFNLAQAEQSKWYQASQIDQLGEETLVLEIKAEESTAFYSTNVLVFLNNYLHTLFKSPINYCTFSNVKKTIDYLIILTRAIRQNGRVSYQSTFYARYWQIIFTLIQNSDKILRDVQLQLKFRLFLDLIVFKKIGHYSQTHEYNLFLKKILIIIPNLKPHYETMARIITSAILNGLVHEKNYMNLVSYIMVNHDLKEEIRDVVMLWKATKGQRDRFESAYSLVKFIDSTRVYTIPEVISIREEIEKYESSSLIKALELFNLPVGSQSVKIYLTLLSELKKRHFLNLVDINFVPIFNKISKYFVNSLPATELNETGNIGKLLKDILTLHFNSFDKFTLDYHVDIISIAGKMKIFAREYERFLLGTVLHNDVYGSTAIAAVKTLAKNGFGFNYKELRAIEEAIRTSKVNWKEVYELLENQMLPELRPQLLNHINNQKPINPPSQVDAFIPESKSRDKPKNKYKSK